MEISVKRLGVLSSGLATIAALVIFAPPAQAASAVAYYGGNWGYSLGVNEDRIVACDGENDGINAFTQYHVGGAPAGTYWTV
jgi:hypothetical protein